MLRGLQNPSGYFRQEKISCPCREWNDDPSVVQPVAYVGVRITLWLSVFPIFLFAAQQQEYFLCRLKKL
jgi:hypothetical protein